MKRTIIFYLLIGLLLWQPCSLHAQQAADKGLPSDSATAAGWYVGLHTGMPMSTANFSSFGADQFRPGWAAGLAGGYRFNALWALEVSATWGQQFMAERSCCFFRDYFLGTDGHRYKSVPTDLAGHYYKDLESRVFVQRYGVQAHMNVLALFAATKDSRWRAELSPGLSAVGTSATLLHKADASLQVGNNAAWHLGLGLGAQASYAVTPALSLGLYGGYTHLTGKPMDGMPQLHVTNGIIDAGLKVTLRLGKPSGQPPLGEPVAAPAPVVEEPTDTLPAPVVEEPADTLPAPVVEEPVDTLPAAPADTLAAVPVTPIEAPATPVEEVAAPEVSPFPVIYFSFNSIWIEPSERDKVRQMADMLKADKSIRIRVTGWGDPVGGEAANQRVSLQRAEAVKRVLGQWLIPADRVETAGAGIKHDAASYDEARVATTIEIVNE